MVFEIIKKSINYILDINELSVRDRADLFFSSTVSGEECREELGIKFSPDRVEVKTPKNLNSAIYPLDWCPENKISMFPFFDNLYNGFKEEYSEIVKLYEEREVKIMLVPAELAVHTVLSTLQTAIDPFLPKAVPLSAAKISQLPANVELGITKHYCPVSLRKRQVLTNGSPNYAEARSAFCAEPHNFVTFSSYMQAPPLRIAVFGPSGSGKSEVCKNLSRHSGVPHVDFEILLKEHILNLSDAEKEEVEVSIRDTAAPPAHPFDTSGFILEHFPRNKSEAELLLKQGFHVDAVVNLKVDAELLGNRIHLKTLKENAAKHLYLQDPSYDPEGELSALIDGIEKEENRVSETISAIESYSSIPVQEIDANRFLRPIISEIKHNLRIFIENRKSILSNARSVDFKTAEDLLKYGVKKFSKFRKYCPITIAKNRCLTRASLGYLPVIHGEFVYYLRTETERKEFLENTFNFIDNPPPEPHIQPSIFIVGPPKSGKTLAAERIARDFDITYLTIPIILQAILDGKEDSELYEAVSKGSFWILDGYPHTFEQAKALEELGVSPNNVIIFDVESGEQIKRTLMDFEQDIIENKQRLNAADVVSLRNENYLNEKKGICEFYTSKYDNCTMISKCCSKWAAANMAHNAIEKTILCKQNYWNLKYHGKAAPIFGVGLNNYHVQENISKYENYCLVTLLDSDELEKGSAGTECVAEYQNMFYRFKNKEAMNKFLACPTVYLSRPGLPELPCRMSASDIKLSFPASMELQGYCPVTLLNGPPGFQSLIHGNCNNVVEYKGKLYVMADEKKTEAFLRNPWKFENLTLPKKLPPNKVEITVANLPM
ncbi:adenylate kinase, partial [Clydaea vesicula]